MKHSSWSVCVAAMLAACSTPPAHPTATGNGEAQKGAGVAAVPPLLEEVLPQSGPSESMSSLRADAERGAREGCGQQGKAVEILSERTFSRPPSTHDERKWIAVNFYCIDKARPHTTPEEKEAKIANLKQFLDKGTLTQDEFDQAKATVLAEP
jgi:putative oligomerization/nucleic acid binding protein